MRLELRTLGQRVRSRAAGISRRARDHSSNNYLSGALRRSSKTIYECRLVESCSSVLERPASHLASLYRRRASGVVLRPTRHSGVTLHDHLRWRRVSTPSASALALRILRARAQGPAAPCPHLASWRAPRRVGRMHRAEQRKSIIPSNSSNVTRVCLLGPGHCATSPARTRENGPDCAIAISGPDLGRTSHTSLSMAQEAMATSRVSIRFGVLHPDRYLESDCVLRTPRLRARSEREVCRTHLPSRSGCRAPNQSATPPGLLHTRLSPSRAT